jgi:pimeloyl-ACP methyl ester carboxylesterase
MRNYRIYGNSPLTIVLVHGGPGAGGEMAPVARELAPQWDVLEPIQTATTLEGQIEELISVISGQADPPVTLVGFSWGAWLSALVTARAPRLVKKLILVSSAPFEPRYVSQLGATRMGRLSAAEREEFDQILSILNDPQAGEKDRHLARLGQLASKADDYDHLDGVEFPGDRVGLSGEVFQGIWQAAAAMRRDGSLLEAVGQIACPVLAIHGDYDPHPAAGVREPLSAALKDFRFSLLERCGHTPWIERHARDDFFELLNKELQS